MRRQSGPVGCDRRMVSVVSERESTVNAQKKVGAAASHQHTCCDCTSVRVRAPAFVFGKSRPRSERAAVETHRYTLHMT